MEVTRPFIRVAQMEKLRPSFYSDLGNAIRRRRKEAGLTQKQLAEWVGVQRNYIVSLEQGRRNPTITVLVKIADELGTVPSVLLKELEDRLFGSTDKRRI